MAHHLRHSMTQSQPGQATASRQKQSNAQNELLAKWPGRHTYQWQPDTKSQHNQTQRLAKGPSPIWEVMKNRECERQAPYPQHLNQCPQ